jgi:hypothetical protein
LDEVDSIQNIQAIISEELPQKNASINEVSLLVVFAYCKET